MKYCEKCGKELINGICPNCNGENVVNNTIPSQKKTNGYAIVGFVLSFFVSIAGLIVSIIGLKKSKELEDGKGLSIAGIIISIVILVFQILVVLIVMSGLFFAANVYPEIKKNLNDEIENRVDDWDTADDWNYDNSTVGTLENKTDENGNTYHSIDLTKYSEDGEVIFKLNDDYVIKVNIESEENGFSKRYDYDLFINNVELNEYEDLDVLDILNFYTTNDKLLVSVEKNSIQYLIRNVFIFDKHDKYDITIDNDFAIRKLKFIENTLSLQISRFYEDGTYHYNNKSYKICDMTYNDLVVEYTDEYDLSSNILKPIKSNEKTLEQYMTEHNLCS